MCCFNKVNLSAILLVHKRKINYIFTYIYIYIALYESLTEVKAVRSIIILTFNDKTNGSRYEEVKRYLCICRNCSVVFYRQKLLNCFKRVAEFIASE